VSATLDKAIGTNIYVFPSYFDEVFASSHRWLAWYGCGRYEPAFVRWRRDFLYRPRDGNVVGDILQVVPSRHVSFMWSYPNLIPLSAAKVRRMAEILEPFAFDAVYGAFSGRGQIDANGKEVVAASVARYIARASEA
jgi:hypothetical protein